MIFFQIELGPMENFVYICGCPVTKQAFVVDPGWESPRIIEILKDNNLNLKYILNTHSHFDHTGENKALKSYSSAEIIIGKNEPEMEPAADVYVKDNDIIEVGELKIEVINTPGHTTGGVCYYVDNKLFTGDTIFSGGEIGRTDLPGGSESEMLKSLKKISALPDNTELYSGHNYTGKFYTLLKEEKNINIYMKEALN